MHIGAWDTDIKASDFGGQEVELQVDGIQYSGESTFGIY